MTEHTPLHFEIDNETLEHDTLIVVGDKIIAQMVSPEYSEFIIRACNSYDELVRALEYMIESHGQETFIQGDKEITGTCACDDCAFALTALNKASNPA